MGGSSNARGALTLTTRLYRTAVWTVTALLCLPHATVAQTRSPLERWILVYAGGAKRPPYNIDDLLHLLAVVDTGGRPVSWLCSGTLFLEFKADSGRFYIPVGNGAPSTGHDWEVYLDSIFAPGGPIARLDSASGVMVGRVGPPDRRVELAIMVPYPDPRADTLRFRGRMFAMHSDASRAAAAAAFMGEVIQRFGASRPKHVSLTAFYWLYEGITPVDTGLVPRVAREVHSKGLRFLWIPSWGAGGAERWKSFGFDAAWQQPNYFFRPEVPATRLDSALSRARAAGMGLELEFDPRLFSSWLFADRLDPYLSALESAPDLRTKPIAIYEGAGALIRLSRSRDAWHRALYERLVTVLRAE